MANKHNFDQVYHGVCPCGNFYAGMPHLCLGEVLLLFCGLLLKGDSGILKKRNFDSLSNEKTG